MLVVSTAMLIRQQIQYRASTDSYEKAEQIARILPNRPGVPVSAGGGEAASIYRSAEEEQYANELLGLNIPPPPD